MRETLQQLALRRARDLAGGVSYLSQKVGVGAHDLDAMLHGAAKIPTWVFLRTVDFINDAESASIPPRGFPENWQDQDQSL